MGLLAQILPAGAAGAEATDADRDAALWPGEEALVDGAWPQRRRDVVVGRACARRALAALGAPVTALPADAERLPRWPSGVVGSITHTPGYVGAVVAWDRQWRAIGIDAEQVSRVRPELMHLIAGADELAWLEAQPDEARARGRTILFTAKEAAYKSQFSLTREPLDFLDLTLGLDEHVGQRGAFHATFRAGTRASLLGTFQGSFVASATHLVTIAVLARACA